MKLIIDNNWCRVTEMDNPIIINMIKKRCSYRCPGCQYDWRFKRGWWDGYRSVFAEKERIFPAGMLSEVCDELDKNKVRYQIVNHCSATPPGKSIPNSITLRDYQIEAVRNTLKKRRGVIQAPTGSGKTKIMIQIICSLGLPSLVITNKLDMLNQLAEEINLSTGLDVGKIGGGKYEPGFVTVSTIQSLAKLGIKKMDNVRVLLVDEMHHSSADQYINTLLDMPKVYYRYGFTATAFRNDDQSKILSSVTGPIIHNIPREKLEDDGFLVPAHIYMYEVNSPMIGTPEGEEDSPNDIPKERFMQEIYPQGITYNEQRNQLIVDITKRLLSANETVLILVDKIEHGEILKSMGNWIFINGSTKIKGRNAIKDMLKSGELKCVITTTIWKEGVDVPAMSALVNAAAGKSKIGVIQGVGRVLRPSAGKSESIVIDFWDLQNKYLLRQSKARKSIYKKNGWTIEIIKSGR